MGTNNFGDNNIQERGRGEWLFQVYNPCIEVGPISGMLTVGKDFHMITVDDNLGGRITIASFPSQNVAYVLNTAAHSAPVMSNNRPT